MGADGLREGGKEGGSEGGREGGWMHVYRPFEAPYSLVVSRGATHQRGHAAGRDDQSGALEEFPHCG